MRPALVILGVPGSGKSSLAADLAGRTGLPVVETDALIAAEVGEDAGTYLVLAGQQAFDAAEDRALARALVSDGIVVCGGGVTDRSANLEALARLGHEGVPIAQTTASLTDLVARLGLNAPRSVAVGTPRRWIREAMEARHARWAALDPIVVSTSGENANVIDALARIISPA